MVLWRISKYKPLTSTQNQTITKWTEWMIQIKWNELWWTTFFRTFRTFFHILGQFRTFFQKEPYFRTFMTFRTPGRPVFWCRNFALCGAEEILFWCRRDPILVQYRCRKLAQCGAEEILFWCRRHPILVQKLWKI